MSAPWIWGATDAEMAALYPCDAYAAAGSRRCLRAVDVHAPVGTVFRWLCQLKAAPYSYDLLDNLGRRSPRTLTPGLERLTVGEPVMIFRLVDFEVDRHLTMVALPNAERFFGPIAITYAVRPVDAGSRLVCAIAVGRAGPLGGLRRTALAWGDLVMMCKQLRTLKRLAESVPVGQ